jgi:outer membrane protein TolC
MEYLITILLGAMLSVSVARADFGKNEALSLLKSNGPKWERTRLPELDAEAKFFQASGARALHMEAYSREYLGRVNQIQLGFATPGDLTIFTAGTTGVEFAYNIIDSAGAERIRASLENQKLASSTKEQYQADLTFLMLYEYVTVQRYRRKDQIDADNVKRAEDFVRLVEMKIKAGLGIGVEMKRAQALWHRERFKKLDTEFQFMKAKRDLADLLGIDELPSEPAALTANIAPISEEFEAKNQALENRPELKVTGYSLSATRELKLSAEKERYPKLTFLGDVGVFGTHVIGGVGDAVNGTVGIQLTMPLLDGGYQRGKIQEEDVKVQNFEIQKRELQRSVASEAVQAVSQFKNAGEAMGLAKTQVDLASEEFQIITRKYSMGTASGFEVANSQANMTLALEMDLEAQFAYEMAKVNYFRTTGNFSRYFAAEAEREKH